MKDFNEFLASISPEDTAEIMNDANQKALQMRETMDPHDPARFGNQIGAISYTIALELLGLYHKWLEQES